MTEKPQWRRVGLPPEHSCRDAGEFPAGLLHGAGGDDRRHGDLGRHHAPLVVDSHQETQGRVEDHPRGQKEARRAHAEAAQEKGYAWNQEAGFLVRKEGQDGRGRDGRNGAHVFQPREASWETQHRGGDHRYVGGSEKLR